MSVNAWSDAKQDEERKPRIFTHRRLRSDHTFKKAIKIPTGIASNVIEPQEAPTTARLYNEWTASGKQAKGIKRSESVGGVVIKAGKLVHNFPTLSMNQNL